jgi:hypothetical protein
VVLDAAEQVTQLTGIVLDITERKQIETQIESLSDRLKLALQAGEIGVWEWDLNNEVYWDERIYEIYSIWAAPPAIKTGPNGLILKISKGLKQLKKQRFTTGKTSKSSFKLSAPMAKSAGQRQKQLCNAITRAKRSA